MHDKIFDIYRQRIGRLLEHEGIKAYRESVPLTAEYAWSKEPVSFANRLSLKYAPVREGIAWGNEWESAWFHLTCKVPKGFAGKELCLRIHTGGEAMVFDGEGTPIYSLTEVSAFNAMYYKDRFVIGSDFKAGDKIEYWVEAAANGLFGVAQPSAYDENPAKPYGSYTAVVRALRLCVFDRQLWAFMLDMKCLNDLMNTYPKDNYRARQLLHILNKALDIYAYTPENAPAARAYLAEKAFSQHAADSALTACAIGHAHIDVGWLWPVRESIRKAGRTFSSQLALMDKYPEYIFGASQAQLYKMAKDNYPGLYEKIKARVKEGRWEIQGGMWVEADSNIISGESMVRQFLHGKNFFMDEFGVEVKNHWLPDVFGYAASLPQIMKKAGCDYFLTQKISWSQVNTFPYHTFRWIGVDGTEVVTHFPPENSYNAEASPTQRINAQNRFAEGGFLNQFMSLMGIGDGGGGPKEEHVENNLRLKNLEGCPKAVFKRADTFFRELEPRKNELPVWNGELYLELHRGTLTTQAHTKRNNRKCEQALTALEFLAACLPPKDYPAEKLDAAWKTVLLNQFHDIIPGSSIHLVYQTTEAEHAAVLKMANEEMAAAATSLFKKKADCAVLVNSLPYPWTGIVEFPDSWKGFAPGDEKGMTFQYQTEKGKTVALVSLPASSFVTVTKVKVKPVRPVKNQQLVLENDFIKYVFDTNGQLISAFDYEEDREVLSGNGNVLSLYNDRPLNYEAWDVDIYYPRDFKGHPECVSANCICGPVRSYIDFEYVTEKSKIRQRVILYPCSKRLDFVTEADWYEQRTMLRTSFPVAINSDYATFDIQYASVKRPTHDNTSWDQAKFEVCGQRYADISQDNYGTALLNDCKYGYHVKGSTLDLNLLRSPKHPDYTADLGHHVFTYSFLPHSGTLAESQVLQEAAALNREPYFADGMKAGKVKPPCSLHGTGVTLEVVKKAEKDDSIILRLVETLGRHSNAVLALNNPSAAVSETSLLEWEKSDPLPQADGKLNLAFKPFEIKTLRLEIPEN